MYLTFITDGSKLKFTNVRREDGGAYLCMASNGIPPTVSRRFELVVECKYNLQRGSVLFSLAVNFSVSGEPWPILLCNTANMGFLGSEMPIMTLLNRFRHVLYPYPCPKWLNFSPIPAKAKIPNLRPILLCNMANMGLLWVGMPIMT